ncbi:MAG: DUF5103 domain-containing protein [Bacteroidota bacterium]
MFFQKIFQSNSYQAKFFDKLLIFGSIMCFAIFNQALHSSNIQPRSFTPDDSDYYSKTYIPYEDGVYNDQIKSVLLHKSGFELSMPIIGLNAGETLKLSFDELGSDLKKYYYTILLCNADGLPTKLLKNEYLEGFTDNEISDYAFSFNTSVKYVHYSTSFPNQNCKITHSGCYFVLVYEDKTPEKPILMKKFWVLDPSININATAKQANLIEERKYKQEVNFTLELGNYRVNDPSRTLKVFVSQNGRRDCVKDLKPSMYKGNTLEYIYESEDLFDGGNEFRHVDLKSIKHNTDRVLRTDFDSGYYHIFLKADERRTFKVYETDDDINGRLLVKTEEGRNSDTESEYVWTYFNLPMANPVFTGNMYLLGALCNWQYNKASLMIYDYKKQCYSTRLLLKQGYYNYQYVVLETGSKCADVSFIEGNHYETANEYNIWVYYRSESEDYDQLIGFTTIKSNQ